MDKILFVNIGFCLRKSHNMSLQTLEAIRQVLKVDKINYDEELEVLRGNSATVYELVGVEIYHELLHMVSKHTDDCPIIRIIFVLSAYSDMRTYFVIQYSDIEYFCSVTYGTHLDIHVHDTDYKSKAFEIDYFDDDLKDIKIHEQTYRTVIGLEGFKMMTECYNIAQFMDNGMLTQIKDITSKLFEQYRKHPILETKHNVRLLLHAWQTGDSALCILPAEIIYRICILSLAFS
jgi:hypothetical protein